MGTATPPARSTAHSATTSSIRFRVQSATRPPRSSPRPPRAPVARATSPASSAKEIVVRPAPGRASGCSMMNAVRAPKVSPRRSVRFASVRLSSVSAKAAKRSGDGMTCRPAGSNSNCGTERS